MNSVSVMLVDDNPVVRKAYEHACRDIENCHVIHAENGRVAVERAEEHGPDIVVMDYYMPEMDGLEASRAILESRPGTIVIMSTTCRKEELAEEMLRTGAALFINKPVNRKLMAMTLNGFARLVNAREQAGLSGNEASRREPKRPIRQPRDLSRLAERFMGHGASGTSALEFARETLPLFDHEIHESLDTVDLISSGVNRLSPDFSHEEAEALGALFYRLSRLLNVVREFPAMVYALNGIGSFLESYNPTGVSEKARNRLIEILREVDDMLFEWRKKVIEEQTADDINFISQPLLYYGLQLETMYDA